MGNEQSKKKELTKNGKISEKHENGSVNGLSATITTNGLEIVVNGDSIVQENGGSHSLNLDTESTETDYVVVESGTHQAPVISEILESTIQREEVKKSKGEKVHLFDKMFKKKVEAPAHVKSVQEKETLNEDQLDVSLPATDPQLESGSSGNEAATAIIAEHREDFEYLQKAEISTQTNRKAEADISTQTGDEDDIDTTTNTEGPVEEVVMMETAAAEDSLNDSVVVIADEVVEETAREEPLNDVTAGIIIEEVVIMENIVYENIVFRAERVEATDSVEILNYHPEKESVNEAESETAAEPESNPNKSIIEAEIVSEEKNVEETAPLEMLVSLPKVVVDCVEAVFVAVSESPDIAAVNMSEPSVHEVITEDNSEGATDMSADIVLIEATEPESNAVIPGAEEAIGVPSLEEEPVIMVSEDVCEESNPTPENQDMHAEESPVPLVTEIIAMVESAREDVTINDAIFVEDIPGVSEETVIVETPSNALTTVEELPEDILNSPDDEVKPESIPEVITTNESAEVAEDVIANVGPETVEEAEPTPVVTDDTEVILEAACDALSQEFELSAITPQEPEVDNGIHVVEEKIAATTFVPLSGVQEANFTISEEPRETTAEEMKEEAIEALSIEFEAKPESVELDTCVQESSIGGEVTVDASSESSEETVEGKTEVSETRAETLEQIPAISEEPVEDNPSAREEDTIPEVLGNILESVVEAISEKLKVIENIVEEPEDVPGIDATAESEPCISLQEELVEENIAPSEVLLEDVDKETAGPSVFAVEPTDSNLVISEEPVQESLNPLEPQVLAVILNTSEDEGIDEIMHETDTPGDILDDNSQDSQIATSGEPVTECVEAVLETIVEEIITQDIAAECILNTSEDEGTDKKIHETDKSGEVLNAVDENSKDSQIDTSDEPVAECVEGVLETIVEELITENVAAECILDKAEDEGTDEKIHETDKAGDISDAVDEKSADSEIATSVELVAECVETFFETIVEEIITVDVVAECNLATLENVSPEIITEGETEESKSSVNSTDSTQSVEMIDDTSDASRDMEALLVRLQSACTSVVEESAFRFGGLNMTSLGYSITVTIHVGPKEELL